LAAAAQAEGGLTTIALPRRLCGYGTLLDEFSARYGIPITGLDPDGDSQGEIDALRAAKGGAKPSGPDVVDMRVTFGSQAKAAGLLAPFEATTWASIPTAEKDVDGAWYGGYYGSLAFEVNTAIVTDVPSDWGDLLKPAYKGQVALAGDPTTSSLAIASVWAAGLATGGSLDDAQPGLGFFKKLNDLGNFVPVTATTTTVSSGQTPIRITWTYDALADKASLAGNPAIRVVVPASGLLGGLYVQAISASAPHPNAARLWMEYLFSDAGQLTWLKAGCHPIRYDDMAARGLIPADVTARLPDISGTQLPTVAQIDRASEVIASGWATTVGVTVR
jgi:putative spermidine/putrescine transport system substrate-binding protein